MGLEAATEAQRGLQPAGGIDPGAVGTSRQRMDIGGLLAQRSRDLR